MKQKCLNETVKIKLEIHFKISDKPTLVMWILVLCSHSLSGSWSSTDLAFLADTLAVLFSSSINSFNSSNISLKTWN